ncbi:MAG: PD40 domain-containing protein, partial [Actinobacteria bacterium]|nr:PD40 domain-containing protein [Actinomycetota bacterium]
MNGRAGTVRALALIATLAMLAGGCTWVTVASHGTDGAQGGAASANPVLDSVGNYMTFQSDASNLVDNDTNGVTDVFKVDNVSGHVERPSVASDGTEANGPSRNPDIDCCGGFIVFESDASNLVPGDTNGATDVFVHNQTTKVTTLVSVASDGGPANGPSTHPVISADGNWIAFESTANNIVPGVSGHQVYVRQWQSGGPTRLVSAASCVNGAVTAGNGVSTRPHIDTHGTAVAFTSTSTNFALDPGNGSPNAYTAPTSGCGSSTVPSLAGYDAAGNIPARGTVATSIGGDGRYVAFDTYSSACPATCSVAGVFVRDRTAGTSTAVAPGDPAAAGGRLNQGGNTIVIQATGPNGVSPVAAVVVLSTGATRVISTDPSGHARAIQPLTNPGSGGPALA